MSFLKGTFNTIGSGSRSIGGDNPIWARVEDRFVGGMAIDHTKYAAGTVIPAGSMCVYAGSGNVGKVFFQEHDATKAYQVGDTVLHSGLPYTCKTAGAAAWSASNWTAETNNINGLVWNDVMIPEGCQSATCAVVRKGRVYADRAGLPTDIEAKLPMIEFVRE